MTDDTKLRLGGMALRNGLLVHGPAPWAAAHRRDDGTIGVASGRKPRVTGAMTDVPGVRGVIRLGEAMAVIPLVKRGLPAARLPWQDATVAGTVAVAALGGAALRKRLSGPAGELAMTAVSIVPSLVALRGGDLAAYHGVEHKAIAAYEADADDAADASKEHERCGSHLMAPMIAANVVGALLLKRAMEKPTPLAGGIVSLAATAAAVEVFAWSERHIDSPVSKALKKPGYELQRAFGTREPDERQLEVGRAALAEILRAEDSN